MTTRTQRRLTVIFVSATALLLLAGVGLFALALDQAAGEVGEIADRTPHPSRLYSRPLELTTAARLDLGTLALYLDALGYRRVGEPSQSGQDQPVRDLRRGYYSVSEQTLELHTREPLHPAGPPAHLTAKVEFEGDRIRSLTVDGQDASRLELEPVELYRYYDDRLVERRSSGCEGEAQGLSSTLALAIMAAEDARFRSHSGVSVIGIARAAMVNLKSGEIRQGASTITQQLARNRFLSHERSWTRKRKEALMALVLDARHDKDELLCAYADLVYLGVRDGVNIVGVGAAAASYFGKTPADLSIAEAATIAGMIAAPARYAPTRDPERSLARRNWVLERLRELDWITAEQFATALAEPLVVRQSFGESGVDARYYAAAVRSELEQEYGFAAGPGIESAELVIDGTLDWVDQLHAERTVTGGTLELEEKYRDHAADDLQAALLSVDPRDGGVRAYVGGRDFRHSQFDRVRQARRQVGSLFKPVIFATAFASRLAHPETPIVDRPIAIQYGDDLWTPGNSKEHYRGTVTVRQALELSINSATLRLAASTGLGDIQRNARALGLDVSREPAVMLGATEASPWELAEAYATFARGGIMRSHSTITSVRTRTGSTVQAPSRQDRRVFDTESTHIINQTLQGVLTRGTAARARRSGLTDPLAGKTGTSNDRRDSWFVGYSPDRLTAVWIGRDGFGETSLTGTTGALPLWTRFTLAIRPHDGFAPFAQDGLDSEVLDYSNEDIWPACPNSLLHPTHVCDDDDPYVEEMPGSGSLLVAANGPDENLARRVGIESQIRSYQTARSGTASVPSLAVMSTPPAEDAAVQDFLELDRRGRIVGRAVQAMPVSGL